MESVSLQYKGLFFESRIIPQAISPRLLFGSTLSHARGGDATFPTNLRTFATNKR